MMSRSGDHPRGTGGGGLTVATFASAEACGLSPGDGCILADVHLPGISGVDLLSTVARAAIPRR
jgi:FixJ family two-component response regulator